MASSHANRYQEIEINSATPTELVVMLYDAAINQIQIARNRMQAGDIAGRARSLNRVIAIISELQANLNFEAGGEISRSLDRLYTYMKNRVLFAIVQQDPLPLVEIGRLMDNLRGAWIEVAGAESKKHSRGPSAQKPVRSTLPLANPESHGAPPTFNFKITA